MKNGVPFRVAMGIADDRSEYLSPDIRTGLAIIFGELDGGKFNWNTLDWEKDD